MNYELSTTWTIIVIILALWELAWKGIALWKASRNGHTGWFLAILFLNTVGILPIVYILTHGGINRKKESFKHETTIPVEG